VLRIGIGVVGRVGVGGQVVVGVREPWPRDELLRDGDGGGVVATCVLGDGGQHHAGGGGGGRCVVGCYLASCRRCSLHMQALQKVSKYPLSLLQGKLIEAPCRCSCERWHHDFLGPLQRARWHRVNTMSSVTCSGPVQRAW